MKLADARAVLVSTPGVVRALLGPLDVGWTRWARPGEWSPATVLAHFIHGEKTDWIQRVRIILETGGAFEPFDRAGHEVYAAVPVPELLDMFEAVRLENVAALDALDIGEDVFTKTGIHPTFGTVTLEQLLATWAAHDMNHLGQMTDEMCRRYAEDVGPWRAFLGVMNR